ncbi:hypothetical protein B8Z93_20590 [Klebsiella pneumoniae]|nr:hypothetical protein AM366_28595 [Escherichia coli]OVJ34812.1 hypothetical protein B8Z93_20590 [Klebsiella pneumoniae]
MRLAPEGFARLQSIVDGFLHERTAVLPDIHSIPPSEWPEIASPASCPVAKFSYPQITARELSIKLQPLCLQSAKRPDFKVRGFL